MINFDNAATTYPKPASVAFAVSEAVKKYGGNPGRSGHRISLDAARIVYNARTKAGKFFSSLTENTVFTSNATTAINMAIKGILKKGDHIIISSLEHNSVSRPVHALYEKGIIKYSVFKVSDKADETLENINSLIKPNTKCICCTAASNVTGQILPVREIGTLCTERGICFICDCAQASGVIPVSLSDGINILCTSGHKGLYGPAGTGLLVTDGKFSLDTIIEGGTGASSWELEQTALLPERLESGTVNVPGIYGLSKGIDFVNSTGSDKIKAKEDRLCDLFLECCKGVKNIKFYSSRKNSVPIVSFNIGDISSEIVASYLNEKGFALRGGLQCAALAHGTLGTLSQGTVRFSPSYFNSESHVYSLCRAIRNYSG